MYVTRAKYPPAAPVNPLSLNTGVDGFAYLNFSTDLSRLRQDHMDTPVTAVGQTVGMVLDDWVTNTIGSNLVSNGTFDTNTTGWTAGSATLSSVSGRLRVTNNGAQTGRAYQSIATTLGDTYKITVDLVTNANGASFRVGQISTGNNMLQYDFAAGVTGSFTFYVHASATAIFLQMYTNTTTAGHLTEWDNVTIKNVAGRNLLQPVATARPILRQHASGAYYLEGDGVDDYLTGSTSMTFALPAYIYALMRRHDNPNATSGIFGIHKNSNNYFRFGVTTSARVQGMLREATLGPANVNSDTGAWGQSPVALAIDSLALAGAHDINHGRKSPLATANTWTGATNLTLCAPGIFVIGAASASTIPMDFFGGGAMLKDPGANRPGIRAYLANLALAD